MHGRARANVDDQALLENAHVEARHAFTVLEQRMAVLEGQLATIAVPMPETGMPHYLAQVPIPSDAQLMHSSDAAVS